MRTAVIVIGGWLLALGLVAAAIATTRSVPASGSADARSFEGGWSAIGRRHTLRTGSGTAAVVQLSGAVVLTDGTGASLGFQGEAIGFDDGESLSAGRAVWTDARGDRVFSALKGGALATGRRITGTIDGGTGRYDGATGDYDLTWQYVVMADEDVVQGRTVDLKGRFRLSGKQP